MPCVTRPQRFGLPVLLACLAWSAADGTADAADAAGREPLNFGLCYVSGHCALEGGPRWVEEPEEVYALERVGDSPEACFARGRHHWQACRNTAHILRSPLASVFTYKYTIHTYIHIFIYLYI
jgi:hypothetical protein